MRTLLRVDGSLGVNGGIEGERLDPLTLAPSPTHIGARLFDQAQLEHALDTLEAGQQEDGGWDFTFAKWNPAAAWEWRGVVSVEALHTLRSYGRIDDGT